MVKCLFLLVKCQMHAHTGICFYLSGTQRLYRCMHGVQIGLVLHQHERLQYVRACPACDCVAVTRLCGMQTKIVLIHEENIT